MLRIILKDLNVTGGKIEGKINSSGSVSLTNFITSSHSHSWGGGQAHVVKKAFQMIRAHRRERNYNTDLLHNILPGSEEI